MILNSKTFIHLHSKNHAERVVFVLNLFTVIVLLQPAINSAPHNGHMLGHPSHGDSGFHCANSLSTEFFSVTLDIRVFRETAFTFSKHLLNSHLIEAMLA